MTAAAPPPLPRIEDIQAAHERIGPYIHRTPVLTSALLDAACGGSLFFKSEHLQKAGAFKARGAANAVALLPEQDAARGVCTHSSGNHGAALALAAARRGIPAHVVMPDNAPAVKRAAVAAYGATIVPCEGTLTAREAMLDEVVQRTGACVVHPYDDERVIAGQGTVALELLAQTEDLEVVAIPVGGGGLLGGMALALKTLRPGIRVLGVEPAGADDAFRSFGLGERLPQTSPDTIADGLRAGLGVRNFALIQQHVDAIVTVSEEAIIAAMKLLMSRMKQVVEPSGAVPYAGVLEHGEWFRGRRAAIVISGGNVDLDRLPWY
jgi:threonine dehydratase